MGARLINNPRRTNIGHVEDFPVLHMRSIRKSAMFSEGQRTEGHLGYPGASNAITIIVDLRYIPNGTRSEKRARAVAAVSALTGALMVARGVHEKEFSDEILRST